MDQPSKVDKVEPIALPKLDPQTEFETKYKTTAETLTTFKQVVEELPGLKKFLYVQGPDYYYIKPDSKEGEIDFARYRKAEHTSDGGTLTFKQKTNSKNNVIRKEDNLDLAKNMTKEKVEANVQRLGYKFNFSIWKMCQIYKYADATLVFYTVIDVDKKVAHFMEIEVDEDTIGELTEDDAWDIIKKYEEILAPTGITYKNRLTKSLFDMYRKSNDKEDK